jgi:P27 family predicted phage terminase small subunit
MRGRKPTPVEVRRRTGNPARRPLPEPVVVGGRSIVAPEPPEDMPSDARHAWDTIVPRLHEIGLLDQIDELALEAMCTQWARAKQAGRVVAEQGHVTLGSTGQMVEHPALATERNAHQMFLKLAEHYALTPIARTRLGLAELQRKSLAHEMAGALGDIDIDID